MQCRGSAGIRSQIVLGRDAGVKNCDIEERGAAGRSLSLRWVVSAGHD